MSTLELIMYSPLILPIICSIILTIVLIHLEVYPIPLYKYKKFRIKKINDYYIVQSKILLFWTKYYLSKYDRDDEEDFCVCI